ncbi:MAG: class I SAM-dependent methyltransferase [bacterium]|nr:MAG: class I SAM-dependent methyltransferase [bacterium]
MVRLLARLLHRIDRLFPRTRVEGRESPEAYSEWEYRLGKDLLERYTAQFGALTGKRVLDIGCGLGGKTIAYGEAGAEVVGVDIEYGNIAQSCRYASSRASAVDFLVGDAEELPFPDESFDLVVANDSMEHFPSPERALPELARVCARGGLLFLFFTPWRSPLGSHLYDYIRTPWCHLLFSERLIEELLSIILERRGKGDASGEARTLMERYHIELNRITVARYRRILAHNPELRPVLEELRPPKYPFLAPLTRLPGIGEFFTGTVVSILEKRTR